MSKLSYVFKISDKDDNLLAQIVDPVDMEISQTMNNFWEANFFLPFNSPYAQSAIVKQFNRVDIYEQIGSDETKIFEGVIRGHEPNLSGTTVIIGDFSFLFMNRILWASDYTASAEAVNTTLTTILAAINSLDDTGISINATDILTTVINKEYARGDNFISIIKDLAIRTVAQFQFKDRKLEFKSTIGIDRSIVGSPDYRSFRFDIDNPNENNIARADAPLDTIQFATAILGKSGANYEGKTDGTTISEYGRIESTKNFPDTDSADLATQAQEYLDLVKLNPQYPNIEPITKELYYQDINLGDVIPIFVNTGSELFSFDDTFIIVKKTLRRSDFAVPRINLEFSENALSDKGDMIDVVNDLSQRVNSLELRS